MAGRGKRDGSKERFWRDMMRQWQRSGQAVREFCVEKGLSEACFYAWRRTIAERDEHAARPDSGRDDRSEVAEAPVFVPVHVTRNAVASALEVVIGTKRVVRVSPGFDPATLRGLLAILEEAPSC